MTTFGTLVDVHYIDRYQENPLPGRKGVALRLFNSLCPFSVFSLRSGFFF